MNKLALVTGSTSGIGLAVAKILAQNGYNILLNGIADENQVTQLLEEFNTKYNIKTYFNGANLSCKEEIIAMIKDTEENIGDIDILINNAGIQYVAPIEEFPDEKWEDIIKINLSSAFYTIKYTIEKMKKKGWGRIINIASAHGIVASVNKSAYVAAKHGIIGLTKTVALETAGSGITCNAICPGWVFTPLVEKQVSAIAEKDNISFEEAKIKLLSEKQPSKTFTKPEDIGYMALHLIQECSANITGSSIVMDGGWTSQ